MKTFSRFTLIGLVLVLFSGSALAVGIRGSFRCGQWIEALEKRNNSGADFATRVVMEMWLLGYLSGMSYESNKEFWGEQNINWLDNQSVFLWMDNYCRAKPLENVADAAAILFAERTRGK
ncbi:MAG: hypothetical protein HY017_25025 [Betaproteobacteria bacterium]|nr:hypothetical protein [Betaproteobacteria bacterium]